MQSPCIKDASEVCFKGCCPNPFINPPEPNNSSSFITSQYNFVAAAASSIQPTTQFTNHESLPSQEELLSHLNRAFPQYINTTLADEIREQEYYHLSLSKHVCLDYNGHGLFSQQQVVNSSRAAALASTSSNAPAMPYSSEAPFFNVSYKAGNLSSQLISAAKESEFEYRMRRRIMRYMNISEDDYSMVFTANQSSAFKLLAESYPFESNHNLITLYDHENEAVEAMIESSEKKGARVISAEFSWPNLKVHVGKLRKKVISKSSKRKRGLFVFPPQSKVTGTRYSYLWMSLAKENGWHVLLDACALGAKDMDTLGLSLFHPDFLVCSFFKVFGHDPSGFCSLFVKKSSVSVLNKSSISMGIVSLIPAIRHSEPLISTDIESEYEISILKPKEKESVFSGISSGSLSLEQMSEETFELPEITQADAQQRESSFSEIVELDETSDTASDKLRIIETSSKGSSRIECRGLDQADTLGLVLISSRARYLVNWLVNALMSLRHPHSGNGHRLVQIYGPKLSVNRGPAVSFNVFDWKGEKVDPMLVQKLADRNQISLTSAFLQCIWFSDNYDEGKEKILEKRSVKRGTKRGKKERNKDCISVVTVSLGVWTNFEDVYRLWAFVSRFLDADFVEKERWRYMALNQTTVEV